jgi:hypothetical protein
MSDSTLDKAVRDAAIQVVMRQDVCLAIEAATLAAMPFFTTFAVHDEGVSRYAGVRRRIFDCIVGAVSSVIAGEEWATTSTGFIHVDASQSEGAAGSLDIEIKLCLGAAFNIPFTPIPKPEGKP